MRHLHLSALLALTVSFAAGVLPAAAQRPEPEQPESELQASGTAAESASGDPSAADPPGHTGDGDGARSESSSRVRKFRADRLRLEAEGQTTDVEIRGESPIVIRGADGTLLNAAGAELVFRAPDGTVTTIKLGGPRSGDRTPAALVLPTERLSESGDQPQDGTAASGKTDDRAGDAAAAGSTADDAMSRRVTAAIEKLGRESGRDTPQLSANVRDALVQALKARQAARASGAAAGGESIAADSGADDGGTEEEVLRTDRPALMQQIRRALGGDNARQDDPASDSEQAVEILRYGPGADDATDDRRRGQPRVPNDAVLEALGEIMARLDALQRDVAELKRQ